MTLSRRQFAVLAAATSVSPTIALAQEPNYRILLLDILTGDPDLFDHSLNTIAQRGDPDMVAGLILALRFARRGHAQISDALSAISGAEEPKSWFDWMLWQERNPQVIPHASYAEFKRDAFLRIDPNFDRFLKPEHIAREAMKIRLEEITWGGVRKDGIPSLDNPEHIPPADATYMRDDDLVFGVSINGDVRAYPLRIMGWHEMFNEVIGGVPVALAYCTLCGSGILFETTVPGHDKPLIFGSSGFLYRSNKLMFDRATHSLWNQFTGEPVSGDLVDSGIELVQRPVVITQWANWLAANPDTTILSVNTGHRRDYGSGVVYNDYFASPDLMFPALVDESQHRQKDYVFGIRQFGGAKAWPLDAFENRPVINDGMLDTPLVLIGDPAGRTVRAYERGDIEFEASDDGTLRGSDGQTWTVTEDALVQGDARLARVAGHIAYWFAWNGYLGAESALYPG